MDNAAAPPLRETLGSARASIASLAWHPRLNQLFAGDSNGVTTGFYEPTMSERGLLHCSERAVKKAESFVGNAAELLASTGYAPHALPLFKEGGPAARSKKRGREREIERDASRRVPMRGPTGGVGTGGRVTEGFQHALMKTVNQNLNSFRDEDPREALLKFDEITKKEPLWTKAYEKTQPTNILAKTVDPNDDEKDLLPQ